MKDSERRYAILEGGKIVFMKEIKAGMKFKLFEPDGEEVICEESMLDGYYVASKDAYQATIEDVEEDRWTIEVPLQGE